MFLLISICVCIALLFGLGWLVALPILPKKDSSFFATFPFVILSGILTNYALVQIVQSLSLALTIATVFSSVGIFLFAHSIYKGQRPGFFSKSTSYTIGASAIILFYAVALVSKPLISWDARSIWFFHAKMIYVAKALSFEAGWTHPSIYFSHVGYPKLVPVLAAQLMNFMGYWNEYLPKLVLVFVLIPPIFWLVSFAQKSWSFCLLICIFPFALHKIMWNGYMDGQLALYLAIALLLLGRFIKHWQPFDFFSCAACFLFLPNLKREGLLLLFLGFLAIIVVGFVLKRQNRLRLSGNIPLGFWQFISWINLSIPTILWYFFYSYAWRITDEVKILNQDRLSLLGIRLGDGTTMKLILTKIFGQLYLPIFIATLVIVLLLTLRRRFLNEMLPPLFIGVAFCGGLIVMYLGLEFELNWALKNSVDRTSISLLTCLTIFSYWGIQYFERLGLILERKSSLKRK